MIQQYDNMNELENELIEEIVTLLNHSIKTKGEATLLLSGGNTPKNLYQKLSLQNIEWDKVNVGLVDERFVDKESPLCNEKMIRDTLIQNQASKARLIGMLFEDHYERNLLRAKEQYKLFLQADILILGMGNDGHTASIFPNDPLSEIATKETQAGLLNTNAPSEPIQRITLNKTFINECQNVFLMFNGQNKGIIFEKSIEKGYPIHHFIPKLNAVYYAHNS